MSRALQTGLLVAALGIASARAQEDTASPWLEGSAIGHLGTLTGHKGWARSVAFAGETLVSGSSTNKIKLWDAARGVELATLSGHT